MDELFLSEQNQTSLRWVVFEDDGLSAWLYLCEANSIQPVAECWLYNRIPAPPASQMAQYQGGPPPASAEVAGPEALVIDPQEEQVSFVWSADGEAVALSRNGQPLGFLVSSQQRGYSFNLTQHSPWGNLWDSALYKELFER